MDFAIVFFLVELFTRQVAKYVHIMLYFVPSVACPAGFNAHAQILSTFPVDPMVQMGQSVGMFKKWR
eukprot:COSAG01_NODE_7710_length_3089_cov_6.196656_5_plen_67_part_00